MDDEMIVITSGSEISPEEVAGKGFSPTRRGYQPTEVRQFLSRVAEELASAADREAELRGELEAARSRAAHPEISESVLTTGLGEHAARLIGSAREMASAITAEAERTAAATLHDAEVRIAHMRQEADTLTARRVKEAESIAANLRQSADSDARSVREQAEAEAEVTLQSARSEGKEMVAEARAVRERMLGDLSRRRRVAEVQLEQLRVARERLVAAYEVVKRTLDEVTAELAAAEPEAREAAQAVGRRMSESGPGSHSSVSEPASPSSGGAGAGTERSLGRFPAFPSVADDEVSRRVERSRAPEPSRPHQPGSGPPGSGQPGPMPGLIVRGIGPGPGSRARPEPEEDEPTEPGTWEGAGFGPPPTIARRGGSTRPGRPPNALVDRPPRRPQTVADSLARDTGGTGETEKASGEPDGSDAETAGPAGAGSEPAAVAQAEPASSEAGQPGADAVPAGAVEPTEPAERADLAEEAGDPAGSSHLAEHTDGTELAELAGPPNEPEPTGADESSEPGEPPQSASQAEGRARVDELFARLRDQVPHRDPGSEPGAQPAERDEPALTSSPAGRGFAGASNARTGESRPDELRGVDAEEDELALARRDQVIDPMEAELVRALKRALQDEENSVLEFVRSEWSESAEWVSSLLEAVDAQTSRFAGAAAPILGRAYTAGGAQDASGTTRFALGGKLANELVTALRERIERRVAGAGEGDVGGAEEAAEAVRSAYRNAKLHEIETIVRHHTASAHALGVFVATPAGTLLRWVVDDDGPCPDCDDNALAGPTPKGEAYPTGQDYPPAHAGCRCVLVPLGT